MKRLSIICITVLLGISVLAQAPQKMSYQAVIRNSNNTLVVSASVGMRISIIKDSINGTPVYVETQTITTNANGLVSLEIGSGTVITGSFASISWGIGNYFIKTETDPTGGNSYSIIGTSQFLSVPYALYAKTAEKTTSDSSNFKHYVGELFGGGIVVGVWKVNNIEHGLIASLTDLSISSIWSSIPSSVGSAGQSITDGSANTAAIIAQGTLSGAAYICGNYTGGGYNDWYLPALWELQQCYSSVFIVNTIIGNTNGFQWNANYWSSTEDIGQNNSAFQIYFYGGGMGQQIKSSNYYVRAVRRF